MATVLTGIIAILLLAATAVFVRIRHLNGARRSRRHAGAESGQGLVEMAILLPLFLVLIVGVVEVANGLNAYITIVNSARDGARMTSKGSADEAAVRNLIVAETDRLRDPLNANADINFDYNQVDGVDAVTVTVCNDHTLLLDVPLVMPSSFRMCSSTAMRVFEN